MRTRRDEIQSQWREQTKQISGVVDEEAVAEVVSRMTGVPLTRLEAGERELFDRRLRRQAFVFDQLEEATQEGRHVRLMHDDRAPFGKDE